MGIPTHHHHSVLEDTKHFFDHAVHQTHLWFERKRTRRQLAEMPSYLLRDIGLTESDRQEEINKSFWE